MAVSLTPENIVVAVAPNDEVPYHARSRSELSTDSFMGNANRAEESWPPFADSRANERLTGKTFQSYCNFLRIGPGAIFGSTLPSRPSDDRGDPVSFRDLCLGVESQIHPLRKICVTGLGCVALRELHNG